jgi:hypothetical protein
VRMSAPAEPRRELVALPGRRDPVSARRSSPPSARTLPTATTDPTAHAVGRRQPSSADPSTRTVTSAPNGGSVRARGWRLNGSCRPETEADLGGRSRLVVAEQATANNHVCPTGQSAQAVPFVGVCRSRTEQMIPHSRRTGAHHGRVALGPSRAVPPDRCTRTGRIGLRRSEAAIPIQQMRHGISPPASDRHPPVRRRRVHRQRSCRR